MSPLQLFTTVVITEAMLSSEHAPVVQTPSSQLSTVLGMDWSRTAYCKNADGLRHAISDQVSSFPVGAKIE